MDTTWYHQQKQWHKQGNRDMIEKYTAKNWVKLIFSHTSTQKCTSSKNSAQK